MKTLTSLITAGADVDCVLYWVRRSSLHPNTCSDGLMCDEPFCEVIGLTIYTCLSPHREETLH